MKTILHIYNINSFYEQLREKGAETIEKQDNQWVINGTPMDNEQFCAIVNDPNARFETLLSPSGLRQIDDQLVDDQSIQNKALLSSVGALSQEDLTVVQVTKKKRVRKQKNNGSI